MSATQEKGQSYDDFIHSDEWRDMHPVWIEICDHRDLLFPWRRVGKVKGKYYPYAIHHLNEQAYERGKKLRLFRDLAVVSKTTHERWFHYILSGGKKRVRYQKKFPNFWQWIANQICRFNFVVIQLFRSRKNAKKKK